MTLLAGSILKLHLFEEALDQKTLKPSLRREQIFQSAMTTNPKAKPYKLKPTDGIMTRDDVAMWEYTLIAACRQVTSWRQFLPGQDRENWIATDEDINNGLEVIEENGVNEEETDQLRNDFAGFLTCVATHSPTGFMDTIMRESTSFKSIITQIKVTYGLQSKGEKFLNCMDIKFEFSDKFTYEMGFMQLKDFFMSSLLPAGSTFKNRALPAAEVLSPLAENFIMKEFLAKVHPKLPEHVKNTKAYLFTEEKPTLACNKSRILSLIDTMLQEIENIDSSNGNMISMGQVRSTYRGGHRGKFPTFRGNLNKGGRFSSRGVRPPFTHNNNRYQGVRPTKDCVHCIEARRFDSAKGHGSHQCPFSVYRDNNSRPNFKVLLVQDPQVQPAPGYANYPAHSIGDTTDFSEYETATEYDSNVTEYNANSEYDFPEQIDGYEGL